MWPAVGNGSVGGTIHVERKGVAQVCDAADMAAVMMSEDKRGGAEIEAAEGGMHRRGVAGVDDHHRRRRARADQQPDVVVTKGRYGTYVRHRLMLTAPASGGNAGGPVAVVSWRGRRYAVTVLTRNERDASAHTVPERRKHTTRIARLVRRGIGLGGIGTRAGCPRRHPAGFVRLLFGAGRCRDAGRSSQGKPYPGARSVGRSVAAADGGSADTRAGRGRTHRVRQRRRGAFA